jgi:hypothetical protein
MLVLSVSRSPTPIIWLGCWEPLKNPLPRKKIKLHQVSLIKALPLLESLASFQNRWWEWKSRGLWKGQNLCRRTPSAANFRSAMLKCSALPLIKIIRRPKGYSSAKKNKGRKRPQGKRNKLQGKRQTKKS